MINVGVVGATGYAGQQLLWILLNHKHVNVEFISSNSYSEEDMSNVYTNYNKYFSQKLISIDEVVSKIKNKETKIDLLFIALPHGMSESLVKVAIKEKIKIIDLGADFRLDDSELYTKWYGVKHEDVNINNIAVYGLPELYKDKIIDAHIVASPGCYPTSSILGIAPLLEKNIAKTEKIIIDSKSGVSGAGRSANIATLFTEVNENFKAYNVFKHRHTPEIKQELDKLSKSQSNIIFTPHLIPINRGILSTIYIDLKDEQKGKQNKNKILEIYKEYYKDSYFVRVIEGLPEIKNVKNTNICEIGIEYSEDMNSVVIVSVIDNLIKGAGGQAVQSMNIMFGLSEEKGLEFLSMYV